MSSEKHRIYGLICMLFAICFFSCNQEKANDSQKKYSNKKQQLIEVNRILVKKDQQRIKGYLKRQNIEMQATETGLWYTMEIVGAGRKAEDGKRATINYRISLLGGRECYSSMEDGSKTFTIGRGGVESGLEEGILLMSEGGKALFIMPPHLAHGLPGDENRIPARATILYEVELLSID